MTRKLQSNYINIVRSTYLVPYKDTQVAKQLYIILALASITCAE